MPASGAARAESCLDAGGTDGKGAWQQHPPPSTLPPSSRPVSQAASALGRRSLCSGERHCRCCPPGWRARRPCRRSRQSPRPQLVQHAAPHQCRAVPCPPLPPRSPLRAVCCADAPASLSQVSGGTTGSRRASVARPSLSSTRRWACAPGALCTRPEWTLGARARGGGGAGGGAGLGWARQHAVAPWGTDGRVSPLTRASGRFSGEDHQEDHAQADVQRVQGRPPEADQARQALRDLRQEAQDQGPDVLSSILIVILLVKN